MKTRYLLIPFALSLGLALILLWALGDQNAPVVAAPLAPSATEGSVAEDYIEAPGAPAAELHVCPAGPPTCDYTTIQEAVDVANAGDVIKVASGAYDDVNNHGGLAQVVYVNRSVTIRGGYATTNWDTPDPEANPTTLDARGQGRVIYITGDISPTLEGLRITGGNAASLSSLMTS